MDYVVQLFYFKKGDEEWGNAQVITGTPELIKTQPLGVYPNPVSNYINFESPNSETIKHLRIYNSMGQLIEVLDINQAKVQWNCQSLALGIYSYEVEIEDMVYRGKFLHR